MFSQETGAELRLALNDFDVPMFAAERRPGGVFFRLLAINVAHEAASGISHEHSVGKTIDELLPPDDAALVNGRYTMCADSGAPLSYEEELTMDGRRQKWNTALFPFITPKGNQRVVGTAVVVDMNRGLRQDRGFDDIRELAIQSSFQLSRVIAYLDAVNTPGMSGAARAGVDLDSVLNLCRSTDSILNSIRAVIEAQATLRAAHAEARAAPATPDRTLRHTSRTLANMLSQPP
ncbi:PAS domain-containing protein [Oceaniglobus indicus]|uniref:PAS domain-containing protein n=1 Tax=Oceaniglobus indicus TaxID=2047749 RepID=UPI000C188C48|nr:PAS domain-containing protein [Oceaniglobus indicus]